MFSIAQNVNHANKNADSEVFSSQTIECLYTFKKINAAQILMVSSIRLIIP